MKPNRPAARRAAASLAVLLALTPGLRAAAPEALVVVDAARLSDGEKLLLASLQGLANRSGARVWVEGPGMNRVVLEELAREGTRLERADSVWGLAARFRDRIDGVILCELGTDSVNVATALSGVKRALVLDARLAARAGPLGLPIALDARQLDEALAFVTWRPLFARGVLCEQSETRLLPLRDFAVARGAFVFAGVSAAERTRFVRELGPLALVFGWGSNEHEFVRDVSRGEGAVVPADWSLNLSALAQLPADVPLRLPPAIPEVEDGERVVAFVMSDGDNLQWIAGGFVEDPGFWASPHRGRFNMTWEMPPALADLAPRAMAHFVRTAKTGEFSDDFVTGPSGFGYYYPHLAPDRAAAARRTARDILLHQMPVVSVLNSGGGPEDTRELLEQPAVQGVLYKDYAPYDRERGRIFWHRDKPCVCYRLVLWDGRDDATPEAVAAAVARLPSAPRTNPDSYALVNVHAWSFKGIGGPMEAVWRTIQRLPSGTRVVTGSQMVALLRRWRPGT